MLFRRRRNWTRQRSLPLHSGPCLGIGTKHGGSGPRPLEGRDQDRLVATRGYLLFSNWLGLIQGGAWPGIYWGTRVGKISLRRKIGPFLAPFRPVKTLGGPLGSWVGFGSPGRNRPFGKNGDSLGGVWGRGKTGKQTKIGIFPKEECGPLFLGTPRGSRVFPPPNFFWEGIIFLGTELPPLGLFPRGPGGWGFGPSVPQGGPFGWGGLKPWRSLGWPGLPREGLSKEGGRGLGAFNRPQGEGDPFGKGIGRFKGPKAGFWFPPFGPLVLPLGLWGALGFPRGFGCFPPRPPRVGGIGPG